jgi:hypothetical protein
MSSPLGQGSPGRAGSSSIFSSRHLTAADLVGWGCVVCFSLRPGGQGYISSAKIIAVRTTGIRSGKSVDETHYKVAATRQTTKPAGTKSHAEVSCRPDKRPIWIKHTQPTNCGLIFFSFFH